ncbi:hypothetical protein [Comamonas jiangduensis]|uniref:hypothetical protein n=1 Tax=Comamonas jiangduensis TaxID=1194168 RepID=UPI0024E0648F|nr:hypothetical protein [Comamonas jiangduensis]
MQQHQWQFFRAGGVDQVQIRTGADIANIGQLDQKLWVALACPTRGIEFDSVTLDLIDQDADGRIRAPELVQACEWAVSMVNDPDVLTSGSDVLQLASINESTEQGQALADEARRILALSGQEGAACVSLADVQGRLASLNAMPFNGDGILNPATLSDQPALSALVSRIMEAYGSAQGCDGQPGLGRAQLDNFFTDVQSLADWHTLASSNTCSLPTEAQAVAAVQALNAVQVKVEDFFARTRLAAFDAKALAPISPSVEGYAALGTQVLSKEDAAIAALPLATVVADGVLPLGSGVNPAWAAAMAALQQHAVRPLLGELDSLSAAQWEQLKAQLQPCQAWLASFPASPLGEMGLQEAQALLASGMQQQLQDMIQHDEDEKQHSEHAVALEKLIRLQRDLLALLNNFVSFSQFYSRQGAAFQAGTLYLDGRSCELTVDVANPAAHATLAGMAKVYLAYCECKRGGDKRHIVAAFTAGDVDFLFVGRNGVFYDREGKDWDATITKLIENPTSIGQAFFSPYKKFVRMIEEQVAKRAAAKDASVTEGLNAKAAALVTAPAGTAAAAAAPAKKTDVGTVAAIGVALGSISTVLVGIFSKFVELGPWIPVGLMGLILAISGPSMLIAWLKLRERSLGPILDASGWAINGRMKINMQLGNSLSQTAKVPANAKHMLHDPFAASHTARWVVGVLALVVLAALAWRWGWVNRVLPERMHYGYTASVAVDGGAAPAALAPAPAPAAP